MQSVRRLEGVRVLITRPKERSAELCFLLEDEGAEVLSLPVLELRPPEDPRPLAAAAETIHHYRWVVFASAAAVEALAEALRLAGTWDRAAQVKFAAVGPRTAREVERRGWKVSAQPEQGTGLALAECMAAELAPGDEVLLPTAELGRRELEEVLVDRGVHVTRVVAYRTPPAELTPEALALLSAAAPHVVLFASPRTAEALLEAVGGVERLGDARSVALGPTTAQGLRDLGLNVTAVAAAPTPEALVEATVQAVGSRS